MKTGRLLSALAGLLIAAQAHADFAPLKTGNVWVFDGIRATEGGRNPLGFPDDKCVLTLKVLSRFQHGDTSGFKVGFQDSLFQRKYSGGSPGALPDTVLLDTLLYINDVKGYRVQSGPGIMGRFSVIPPDAFFSRHVPVGTDTLKNDPSGKLVLKRGWADSSGRTQARAWYVDNVGPQWISARYFNGGGDCSVPVTEELMLRTFNGRAVTLDETPAGSPLAKEAKVTCAIRKRSRAAAAFRALGSLNVDLQGRVIIEPAALSF